VITRCFISYRWDESQAAFARHLAARLNRFKGLRAWIDVDEFRVGVRLHDWLERGIRTECDVFIPILSPEYLNGPTCQKELSLAVKLSDSECKPILPVVVVSCNIPLILGDLTWADFRPALDGEGNFHKEEMRRQTQTLVKSIRYHAQQSIRISHVRSSQVRNPEDFYIHLLYRIHNEAKEWRRIDYFFPLFCDIAEDRGFSARPEALFAKELKSLEEKGFIRFSGSLMTFTYRDYTITGLPQLVRIARLGEEAVRKTEDDWSLSGC
jgi:hypothetical protein